MTELNGAGRAWLLDLAGWFERNAGKPVQVEAELAADIAEKLRVIAGSGDVSLDLERWYQEVGHGE